MTDLICAKKALEGENITCALCKGENIYTSQTRGVKPLVKWLEGENSFKGYSAADKVVGRGAAFLYVLLGVKAVYARVISEGALEVLNSYGINAEYDSLVPYVVNRAGDGICPFEAAVLKISDASAAYCAIKNKLKEMNISV